MLKVESAKPAAYMSNAINHVQHKFIKSERCQELYLKSVAWELGVKFRMLAVIFIQLRGTFQISMLESIKNKILCFVKYKIHELNVYKM